MKSTITKEQLAELSSDNPRIKYRRAKMLVAVVRRNPRQLSAHIPFFVRLLQSENSVLKWTAIDILGFSAGVMKKDQIVPFIDTLMGFLQGGRLISANHAITALSNIARTKPEHQEKIIRELLAVEHYTFETEECRNIALGKVLEAIGSSFSGLKWTKEMVAFAHRQSGNSRSATRKKAEKLLKKVVQGNDRRNRPRTVPTAAD